MIDFHVMSKYCHEYAIAKHILYKGHRSLCSRNHIGSSGIMEVKAAEVLWKRSCPMVNLKHFHTCKDGMFMETVLSYLRKAV